MSAELQTLLIGLGGFLVGGTAGAGIVLFFHKLGNVFTSRKGGGA